MPAPLLRKTRSRAFVSSAVQYTSPVKHANARRQSWANAEAGPSRLGSSRPPQKRLRGDRDQRLPPRWKRKLTESESEEIFADDSAEEEVGSEEDEENVDVKRGLGDMDYDDDGYGGDSYPPKRAIGNRKTKTLNRILSPLQSEKARNKAETLNLTSPARRPLKDRDRARRQSSSIPHAHVHFRASSLIGSSATANIPRRGQLRSHTARMPRKQVQGRPSRLSSLLAAGSPRKRKRDDEYSDTDGSSEADEDSAAPSSTSTSDVEDQDQDGDIYMDQEVDPEDADRTVMVMREADEGEAEARDRRNSVALDIIADSDQHLLHEATAGQLNRLRKAELIRLWKVAGMWTGEEELDELGVEGEDDEGSREHGNTEDEIGKKELAEGLIEARATRQSTSPQARRHLARPSQSSGPSSRSNTVEPSPQTSSTSSEVDESSFGVGKGKAMIRDKDAPRRMKTRHSLSLGVPETDRKARLGAANNGSAVFAERGRGRHSSQGSSATSSAGGSGSGSGARPRLTSAMRKKPPVSNGNARHASGAADQPIDIVDSEEEDRENDNATADDEAVETDTDSSQGPKLSRSTAAVGRGRKRRVSRPTRKAKETAMAALAEGEQDSDVMDVDGENSAGSEEDRGMDENDLSVEAIATPEQYKKRGPTTRSRSGVLARTPSGNVATSRHLRRRETAQSLSPRNIDDSSDEEASSRGGSPEFSPSDLRRQKPSRRSSLVLRLEGMEIDATNGTESDREDEHESRPDSSTSRISANPSGVVDEDMECEDDEYGTDRTDSELAEADEGALLRYRKETLINMCEARELATDGTKRDLVTYLLGWRDTREAAGSSPSSASTARQGSVHSAEAPPTAAPRSHPITVPLLLRNHSTVEDPDTPPLSAEHDGQEVVEGGLDLEELGLLDREIDATKVEKGAKIGSGGYKDVFIGKIGSKSVAVCEFRGALSEMDIRELKLLAEFNHPNIVRLLGLSVPEDKSVPCMVITELCHKGDLFDYIRKTAAPTLRKILKIMIDIASGLEYLHERKPKVIHRDCKSSNILITASGKAKVGDFGLARVKSTSRSVMNSLVGTVNWQAPELWHPKPRYDYKVDVFSCGMVFWEMLHGWHSANIQYPWEGKNEHWIYDAVGQKRQRPPISILRKHWGGDIIDLVERMWAHDPAERPTMTDVLDDLRAILGEQPRPPMRL